MDLVPFSSLLLQSISSPSITSFSILLLFTLQLVFPRLRASDVLDTQFWVALIYSGLGIFAVFFIILDIDLAGSLSGSGLAVTPVVILLAFFSFGTVRTV